MVENENDTEKEEGKSFVREWERKAQSHVAQIVRERERAFVHSLFSEEAESS